MAPNCGRLRAHRTSLYSLSSVICIRYVYRLSSLSSIPSGIMSSGISSSESRGSRFMMSVSSSGMPLPPAIRSVLEWFRIATSWLLLTSTCTPLLMGYGALSSTLLRGTAGYLRIFLGIGDVLGRPCGEHPSYELLPPLVLSCRIAVTIVERDREKFIMKIIKY